MKLVQPSKKYQASYLEAAREFRAEGKKERYTGFELENIEKNFSAFVKRLSNIALGRNLPEGYVQESTFWLVDDERYIGRISVRHTLTDTLRHEGGHIGFSIRPSMRGRGYGTQMLRLVLPKARDIGLDRVLLVCVATNAASRKIIEHAGGVLEGRNETGGAPPNELYYYISLS